MRTGEFYQDTPTDKRLCKVCGKTEKKSIEFRHLFVCDNKTSTEEGEAVRSEITTIYPISVSVFVIQIYFIMLYTLT